MHRVLDGSEGGGDVEATAEDVLHHHLQHGVSDDEGGGSEAGRALTGHHPEDAGGDEEEEGEDVLVRDAPCLHHHSRPSSWSLDAQSIQSSLEKVI